MTIIKKFHRYYKSSGTLDVYVVSVSVNYANIGWNNGLAPRYQAIIWNNECLQLIEPLWTNFSEISIQKFNARKLI